MNMKNRFAKTGISIKFSASAVVPLEVGSFTKLEAARFVRMLLVVALAMVVPKVLASVVFTNLHSFVGPDGENPGAALVQGIGGNFFGTTPGGGTNGGYGTVFKISSNGILTSLYSFTGGADGSDPGALVQGRDGNFYGTVGNGKKGGYGSLFKISTNGTLTTFYSFTGGADGASPNRLVQGSDGNFYGTTLGGGIYVTSPGGGYEFGTVFKISTNGILTSLYSFTDGSDGIHPNWLVQGSDGNFYGTAEGGMDRYGTVFEISTNGTLTSLYSFTGGSDEGNPNPGLIQGSDGNFYGTTQGVGVEEYGTVFEISTNGALTTLYTFTNGSDGAWPDAGPVQGSDGNFYGTASGTGQRESLTRYGNVFKMSSDGTLTNLYSFTGGGEGAGPNWLVQGSDGNFYGTTPFDGISGNGGPATGNGIVFRISVSSNLPSILTSDGSLGIINNQFGFTIAGASGSVVVVQASTNLANPGWVPVSTNTVVGGTSFFSDPQWTNYPSRFYRLQAY